MYKRQFETMYFNEFASTEYAALYTTYNTGRLFIPNKYINPEFEWVNNIGVGHLLNGNKLTNIEPVSYTHLTLPTSDLV